MLKLDCQSQYECFIDRDKPFQMNAPILVDGKNAVITEMRQDSILIRLLDGHHELPEIVQISQNTCSFQQAEVFDALTNYWQQFWTCDLPQHDTEFHQEFQTQLPLHPSLHDDFEENLEDWKNAISESKGDSAPGVDGFTFKELKMLPDQLLLHLIRIVASMTSFPKDMMLARTVPIPKKGQFTAENSRPITILATIYRLWGRVCTKRCLKHLTKILSDSITGMLPKRGAQEASYQLQALIEAKRYLNEHITGLTLDLKKCFNLLNREKVARLMIQHGLPPRLVTKWKNSIHSLCRYWDIAHTCSEVLSTNNACPEGDSWSVVAMLIVSESWIQLLKQVSHTISTNAYADNWTLFMPEACLTITPVLRTSQFVDWMGLQISWKKTWTWSTSSTGAKKFNEMIQEAFPGDSVSEMLQATDLGCQMTYHGTSKMGIMNNRMQQAKARLDILKLSAWVLPLKAFVVQASVLPLALYGCEMLAVGQRHLQTLRTQIADAMIGESVKTMSSSLFLHCLSDAAIDPFLKTALLAMKAAKKFLVAASPQMKATFLKITSKPSEKYVQSSGPASALREYLQRLGLHCSQTGEIQVTAMRFVNIVSTPFKDIEKCLPRAWQEQLLVMHTNRSKICQLPPINQLETVRVLRKFQPKQQLMLLREIAGAFQTREQQSKWNPDVENTCVYCGEEGDDRPHRNFRCHAFADVRHEHAAFLETLQEINPHLVELPVIHLHPHWEFHDALLFSMPDAIVPQHMVHTIQSLQLPRLNFYTDGSCRFPTFPETCYSAFAVIADLSYSDEQRRDLATTFQLTGAMPVTLQKLIVGRTKGRQQIHRAELSAIIAVFRAFDECVVHTDSAMAIHLVQLCRTASSLAELAMHDDFDLLEALFPILSPHKQVVKVKAHQKLADIKDSLHRYYALGNDLADTVANSACTLFLPEVVEQLDFFHEDLVAQREQTHRFYQFNLDLQVARARAQGEPDPDSVTIAVNHANVFTLLTTWKVEVCWPKPSFIQDAEVRHCVLGFQWAVAMLQWLENCRWPIEPISDDPGISWAEIALVLAMRQQQWLPIKRLRGNKHMIMQPFTLKDIHDMNLQFSEQATMAYTLMGQVRGLVAHDVIPNYCAYGKTKSLYLQGGNSWTTGITTRPEFGEQTEMFQIMRKYLMKHSGQLQHLPDVFINDTSEPWGDDMVMANVDFLERTRRSRLAMRRVRLTRKAWLDAV